MESLSLIIPAYNEEGAVGDIVRKIKSELEPIVPQFELIIVDDGSTDNTASEAEGAGAKVLRHSVNTGYGSAIMTGMEAATHNQLGLTDADGTYPIEHFPALIEHADKYDLVVGARTGMNYWSSLIKGPARIMFHMLAEFVTGHKILDLNSGMRLFKKSDMDKVGLDFCRGFSFTTTQTVAYLSEGRTLRYVPVPYAKRIGRSKVSYFRDTLRAAQILIQAVAFYNPLKAVLPLVLAQGLLSLILFLCWVFNGAIETMVASGLLFVGACVTTGLGYIMYVIRASNKKTNN